MSKEESKLIKNRYSELKRRNYYVVEVELFEGNFRHKAIFCSDGKHYGDDYGTLFTIGYEVQRRVNIETLHYFNILSEIKEMNN